MSNDIIFLGTSFILICIGFYCLTQKNLIRILLGIEMLLNSGNLLLVYFASYRSNLGFVDPLGQSFAFLSIILGGSTIAIGLALVVNVYKHTKSVDADKLRRLKW